MSKARNSLKTTFSVETTTAGTYVKIDEIVDIPSVIGDKAGKIDVTNMDSEGYKEYIADLKDAIEITVSCNHIPDDIGQLRVKALAETSEVIKFKMVLPDAITPLTGSGTTIIRNGYISSRQVVSGKGKQLMMNFSIQFSGAPIETAAS